MIDKIVIVLQNFHLGKDAIIAIVSMLPIVELRGAIPLGIVGFKMNLWRAFFIAIFFHVLIIAPLLWFLNPIRNFLSQIRFLKKFFNKLDARTMKKGKDVMKYGAIGLALFVAIPLPGTGAWSGSLLALLFDIDFKWAFPAILLGVLVAGIIVTLVTAGVVNIL